MWRWCKSTWLPIMITSMLGKCSAWMDEVQLGHVTVEDLRMEKSAPNDWSLKKGKTTDLVRESKRRFEFVVRLIANECYRTYCLHLATCPGSMCELPSLDRSKQDKYSFIELLLAGNDSSFPSKEFLATSGRTEATGLRGRIAFFCRHLSVGKIWRGVAPGRPHPATSSRAEPPCYYSPPAWRIFVARVSR